MFTPSTSMLPSVGRSSPPMRLSSVVLPEPEGPMSATKSPRGSSRSSFSSTGTTSLPRRYCLATPRSRATTGSLFATACSTADMWSPSGLLTIALFELDLAAILESFDERRHQLFSRADTREHLDLAVVLRTDGHRAALHAAFTDHPDERIAAD